MDYASLKSPSDRANFVIFYFLQSEKKEKLRTICNFLTAPDNINLMLVNRAFRKLIAQHEKSKLPYFVVAATDVATLLRDPATRLIVENRYRSDRYAFQRVTGVKFASNPPPDQKEEDEVDTDNSSDDEDEDEEDDEDAKKDNDKHKKKKSVVDELLGKSAEELEAEKKVQKALKTVFSDELGALDFAKLKWLRLPDYDRTFWLYILKYQKLLIEQYMLLEERVVSEEHTQPFVSCLANLHDLDFSDIEKISEKYKIKKKLQSNTNLNQAIASIAEDADKQKLNSSKNMPLSLSGTPDRPSPGAITPDDPDAVMVGDMRMKLSDFRTFDFKHLGRSWLRNVLSSNFNLVSVLDLSGCGLADSHVLELCDAWGKLSHTSYLQILSLGSNVGVTDASMPRLFDCIKMCHSQLYYLMLYDTRVSDETCYVIYNFYKFHFGEPIAQEQIKCDRVWQGVVDSDFNEARIDAYFDKLLHHKVIPKYDFNDAKRDYYSMKIGALRRKKVEMLGLRGNTQLTQIRLNWCKSITKKGISRLDLIFKEGLLPGVAPDTGLTNYTTTQRRSSSKKKKKGRTKVSMTGMSRGASYVSDSGRIESTQRFDPRNLQYFDEDEKIRVFYNRENMAILVDALDLFDKRSDKHQQNLIVELKKKQAQQQEIRKKIKRLRRKMGGDKGRKVKFDDESKDNLSPTSQYENDFPSVPDMTNMNSTEKAKHKSMEKEIATLEKKWTNLNKEILQYDAKLQTTKRLPSWDRRIKTDPDPNQIWDEESTVSHFELYKF